MPGDDRNVVEHHGRIFDENAVWQLGRVSDVNDAAASRGEAALVFLVLRGRAAEVDRPAVDVAQLAAPDVGTERSSDRNPHALLFTYGLRSQRSARGHGAGRGVAEGARSAT